MVARTDLARQRLAPESLSGQGQKQRARYGLPTGTELERRGVPMHDVSWSGIASLSHPDILRQVHVDYVAAGAEVVIANTFAASRYLLEAAA